jgi:transcriptional regulator with XRE-family HTH domain
MTRSDRRLEEELPDLLAARGWSLRQLARESSVDIGHLSRLTGSSPRKEPTARVIESIAEALGVPADHFPDYRELVVREALRRDLAHLDRIYDEIAAHREV